MKKSTLKLAVFSMMMTAMLFNCKDKDKDPETPDENITKALDAVTIVSPTLDKPAEVQKTESKVEMSAQAAAVNSDLANIAASGVVPASVTAAASSVSGAVSASEVATLNAVSPATISQVAAGGELSPELKAILDKAMANPALAAYLPKFTFPTVNGVALKGKRVSAETATGARTSGTDAVEKVEKVLVSDACVQAANDKFAEVKTKLDGQKATETGKVDTQYAADIAPIAAAQTTCSGAIPARNDAYRAEVKSAADAALASLENAKAVLGDQYDVLKAMVNIQLLGAYSSINSLQLADVQFCTAVGTATKAAADAVRTSNQGKVDAAYNAALAEANSLKTDAIASCHNQGGGN